MSGHKWLKLNNLAICREIPLFGHFDYLLNFVKLTQVVSIFISFYLDCSYI
ncbi:hypothetical protein CRYPA_1726 [uncultured Candidatus Thioglobus sp.]|nr:hypothetical protein CRYPA_1726 [uncultured Candidatus Thioglobus sp.]